MKEQLKDLIEISRYYGTNKEYVIAGGGNTSFKNNEYIWVKASGIALADITKEGFVCLSREKLKTISERTYSNHSAERENQVKTDLYAAIVSEGKRPSVESSMHDIIEYPFVVHTHPTLVNSLMCSVDAKAKTSELFGKDVLFIEYTDPGYVLFKKVASELENYKQKAGKHPSVIFLENHGVFVSAGSIHEIKTIYSEIEKKISTAISTTLPSDSIKKTEINTGILTEFSEYANSYIIPATCELINAYLKSEKDFETIRTAFTPDHIVYCKSRFLFLESYDQTCLEKGLLNFKSNYGYIPKVLGIKNKGLLIADENEKSAQTVLELVLNMMKIGWYAKAFGGSKPMTDKQIEFIENWEVENYRRSMAKK